MRNANRPSGPGKPTNERRDNAVEREELDEVIEDKGVAAGSPARDGSRSVRQAERDAHVKGKGATAASGTSGNRRRG